MTRGGAREQTGLGFDRFADWSMTPRGPAFKTALFAGAYAAALGLRFALDPHLPPGYPFITFFPAVALTAVLIGTRSGLAMAALCLLSAWYFFLPPAFSWALPPGAGVALLLYLLVVGTEVGLVYLMRRALARALRAEEGARGLAQSRSLMFAELQHRTSNNFAVVGSLLALQRRGVADPTAVRALEEAAARLATVARLNRLLHDPEAQEVDFGAFLHAMVPDVVEASGAAGRIAVEVRADPVTVPAAQAIPLGLIATELLSNAVEHGFPEGRRGRIEVALDAGTDATACLTIRDDGAGLPAGFELGRTRSLGLTIVRQFAGQMRAALSLRHENGAVARLDFPLDGRTA